MLSIFDAWIQGNFIVAQKEQADQERLTDNALFKVRSRTRNRCPLMTWAVKDQFTLQRQTQTDSQPITFQDSTNTDIQKNKKQQQQQKIVAFRINVICYYYI